MSQGLSQSFYSVQSFDSKPDSVTRSNAMLFERDRVAEEKSKHPYRRQGVYSFLVFLIGTIIFLTAFGGTEWFVMPPINYSNITSNTQQDGEPTMKLYREILFSTCDLEPEHLPKLYFKCPVTFGIWKLCYRDHCVYDISNNYMLVNYLPYEEVRRPFDDIMTPIQWLMCLALILIMAALAIYLAFLAGFTPLVGFAAVICQGLAGILVLAAVILFGVKFRGSSEGIPLGWSFWMAVVSLCILVLNAGVFALLIIFVMVKSGSTGLRFPKLLSR